MSKQTINVGTGELTGNGESIRSAFVKINSNFTELYTTAEGNTYYVSENGSNSNSGGTISDAFRTIRHALTQATAGDIVKISAGSFTETFPLEIPQGVTVKGSGLRSTEVKPTTATNTLNGFLLNGESTVEDLTIRDMFYDSINDTGYAFSYSTTTVIALRSPYVQRVTVLNRGSNPTASDPYGYISADAGRGAIADGQYVSRNSLQASFLFNEVTFIVPNSRGFIMTNGARSEFLNCFSYFADVAIEGKVGAEGRGGEGKTYIGLENVTGTFEVGDTIDYYSSVGTLLASYPIESIVNGSYVIDGSASGYATFAENRTSKTVISIGGAVTTSSVAKFGSGSLALDGDGDYIRIQENLIPALGNFTVEGWIYPTVTTGTNGVFYFNGYNTDYAGLKLELVDSQLKLSCSTNGSAWDFEITTSTVTVSTWTHVSIERIGGNIVVHADGVPIINTDVITSSTTLSVGSLNYIGSINDTNEFTGYIDEVRVSNIARYSTGTFTVTDSAYQNDNNTVMLLHFNGSLSDDDGPIVQDIRSSGGATATRISRYDRSEFAAELRAFACANVYGNFGVKADGADVKLNLIAHNFGYMGTGYDLTNDRSAVVQANEVVELNGGHVYYDTVDQDGNYRIGDLFTVNFETGAVSFQGPSFDVSSLTGINFTDGTNTTVVNPTGIETGNLVLSGNSLVALTGGLTIDPGANQELTLNGATFISGGVTVDGKTAIFAPVPASSIGSPGDREGLFALSSTHIYHCTSTYDGVTNIWKRVAWSGDTW